MIRLGLILALASPLIAASPAAAFSYQQAPFFARQALEPVPERAGVLPWRVLAGVGADKRGRPAFSAEQAALDGTAATIEGYMMPYDDAPRARVFLVMAMKAHCAFCIPGGPESLVEVRMTKGLAQTEALIAVTGTLRLLRDGGGLYYALDDARPAPG